MANDHHGTKAVVRRSCKNCKKRHLKCELVPQPDGAMRCVWCLEHGFECVQQGDEASTRAVSKPPNDGSIIMSGDTSAFGGFQLSKKSFYSNDAGVDSLLRMRQDITEKSTIHWQENDGQDEELRLDKVIVKHLEQIFFDKIQPYIPIISRTYFNSIQPTQLLLAAIYGVAARLPGAIISSRDFTHIKRVLLAHLSKLINNYKPSLQACIALCLIHLTVELQCEGIEGVEAWPLRLGMVVRMALELRLHRKAAHAHNSPHLQEMKRKLFWAIFTKDRWTSTGKGYPLMISLSDLDVDLPSVENLDGPLLPQHSFFVELIHQAICLGKLHKVTFRADRFARVTVEAFREVEREVDDLGHRLRRIADRCDPDTRATLELNYATIRLLFYGPFFRPNSDAEAMQFSQFIPNLSAMRRRLAKDAVYALEFASKELLYSGPAIWGIGFYAQVRCFLVALSVKHDDVTDYSPELQQAASEATEKVVEIARQMCEEKRWCFMLMSGTLVLFTARIAEQKAEEAKEQRFKSREATPELVQAEATPTSTIITQPFENEGYISSFPPRKNSITTKNGVNVHVQSGDQTGVMTVDNAMNLGTQDIGPHQHQFHYAMPVPPLPAQFVPTGISNNTVPIVANSAPNHAYIMPPGPGMGANYGAYNDWDLGGGYENVYGTDFEYVYL